MMKNSIRPLLLPFSSGRCKYVTSENERHVIPGTPNTICSWTASQTIHLTHQLHPLPNSSNEAFSHQAHLISCIFGSGASSLISFTPLIRRSLNQHRTLPSRTSTLGKYAGIQSFKIRVTPRCMTFSRLSSPHTDSVQSLESPRSLFKSPPTPD